MEGVPPSSMEDDANQLDSETFNMSELLSSPSEEVQVNQSSMLQNPAPDSSLQSQNTQQMEGVPPSSMDDDVNQLDIDTLMSEPPPSFLQTMITMGGLDGASSSWINQNGPDWPQTPSREQQWTNELLMSNQVPPITPNLYDPQSSTMLPEPSQTLRFPQLPPHNLQVSGHPNQGQVDQASVIPHIDNMQQESLVPRNVGRSTRSQMEKPQVHVLQNENARPNASDAGPDSSLQSQNRGLNTQQVKMARSNDPFWNYVEYMADGSMKCNFCSHTYAMSTSISRIKWHLSGEQKHGVTICHGVTKEVQEEALKAMGGGNKRDKSITSSINVPRTAGRRQVGIQGTELGVREERIQSHSQAENAMEDTGEGSFGQDAFQTIHRTQQVQPLERCSSCERPSINPADEPRGDSSQPSNPLCLDHGRCYDQPFASSVSNDVIMNDVQNMVRARTKPVEEHNVENSGRLVQPDAGARSSESLKDSKTRGVPFPTSSNKLVGQAFEENRKVIWSLLMDDELSTIGIYGMGGVGKTTILQHIHNELLDKPDICDHVWWVTVSRDFSINRLQNLIGKRLSLDLSSEDDDLHRAAKLSEELRQKKKWILILDDLWSNFELHEVGIPIPLKGCKLILTTRSRKVCDQIDCQHKIKVKPLLEEDSWNLFKENLGHHIALSDEVEGIAKVVARECAGLPLGIITIASSLRRVDDLHEWRTTLKKLKYSEFRDMKVFKLLRFSYDRLGDSAIQQCLLYCALFREDHLIESEELIGYLIDEGIIKGMGRRQDAFDEGHTMLNRLQYVCLLESDKTEDGGKCVKMHDLIRDMAIQILQENSQVIVKAGAQLVELPDAEEWTENLTRVSLMQNRFEEIHPSHSPMCPNLSTLLLCQNYQLRFIADSFFKQLHGLKLLDLSHTDIEKLPDSVSDLVSLTALLLRNCFNLGDVPSLEKLTALKSLDLYGTSLGKMPQGMEGLSSLRYFRINGCRDEEFPSGILPKLSHLQVLALGEFPTECLTVEGMEVGCLGKLETLECHFEGFSDFVEYFRSRDGIQSLSTYKILVGTLNEDSWFNRYDFPSKTVLLGNLSINRDRDFQVKFVNDIQGLYCECIDARSLCDVLSLENATELEIIVFEYCDSMESLVSSSWFSSAPAPLPSHNGMFSRLKKFHCYGCHSMEKLFPLELLSYLVNLEVIAVSFCGGMEEIIGTTDEESSTSNPIAELALPKLNNLYLSGLPELKRICSGKLICNSLGVIIVEDCEKLKRMAICLPLLENGQPSPHPSLQQIYACPREWWDTVVEWEPPNTKEVLRPIVHSWR